MASVAASSAIPSRALSVPRLRAVHLGYALLFLMIFLPTTYQTVKAPLLGLLLVGIVTEALIRGEMHLHPRIATLTLAYVALGLFYVLRGELNTAPGALRSIGVYAVWPLVFMLLISGLRDRRSITGLVRTLIVATLAIELYSLLYIAYSVGWIPGRFYLPLDQGQEFSLYPTYFAYNLYSIASLFFLVPFLVALLLIWPRGERLPVGRFWVTVAALLGFVLVVLSARRALLLVVALSPLVTLALATQLPRSPSNKARPVKRAILGVGTLAAVALVYVGMVFNLTPARILASASAAFTSVTEESPRVRVDQYAGLVEGWEENPMLGSGLGQVAPGIVRSSEMPWAYELSYVSLLFHVGLIGITAYGLGVLWIIAVGVRIIRRGASSSRYMIAIFSGTAAFLLGNATNPYLEKFDYLWVLFVPIALINQWLLDRSETEATS